MEICVRYSQFFEYNATFIPTALDAYVRFCHSDKLKVRTQAWYHFQRFARSMRGSLGEVAPTVIQAISDLLTIKAVVAGDNEDDGSDDNSVDSNESTNNDPLFNSQLYLFEAIGCITSASTIPNETKILYIQTIINPIFSNMEQNLASAKNGDERSIMQVHHDIMALGNISHGFTDWMPGVRASHRRLPSPRSLSDVEKPS
jgi:exportin-T